MKKLFLIFFVFTITCTTPYMYPKYPSFKFSVDPYSKFVHTVNNNFIDSLYNSITLDTSNHPPIDTLIKQTDKACTITYRKPVDHKGFGNIGIYLKIANDYPVVVASIDKAPAYRAGIIPDDTLISIDNVDLKGIALDSVIYLLRGSPWTKVELIVKRDTVILPKYELIRNTIQINEISHKCLLASEIGYIKISIFGHNILSELENEYKFFCKKKCKALIIDVRNNPGGLFNSAIETTELFLPPKSIICKVKRLSALGDKTFYSKSAKFQRIPLVIIIDSTTSAGAEIFAAALKENNRAILIGTKTAGFGTLQSIISLDTNYSLKLTTGYLLSPLGNRIQKHGVYPNVPTKGSKDFKDIKLTATCNDLEAGDNQLQIAIKKTKDILLHAKIE